MNVLVNSFFLRQAPLSEHQPMARLEVRGELRLPVLGWWWGHIHKLLSYEVDSSFKMIDLSQLLDFAELIDSHFNSFKS